MSSSRRPPKLGILGGGQLARMMAQPAIRLGIDVYVLDRAPNSPAALAGARETVGDWNDIPTLLRFSDGLDVITLDHEFVDAQALWALEQSGQTVRPGSSTLAKIQDKLVQKQTLADAGLPVAPFREISSLGGLALAGSQMGWPLYLKTRRDGYDGKGNRLVTGPEDVPAAWKEFGSRPGGVYVEGEVPFTRELAVMVVRTVGGRIEHYPLVETIQRNHICRLVLAPAIAVTAVNHRAIDVAIAAANAVETVGALVVELFETADGEVLVNELAPRPHNSGHYTIEACRTSQFENHVRAVLDLPLGSCRTIVPAAVMMNLLAGGDGPGRPAGIDRALAVPDTMLHLYGKAEARTGRKMGHVTAVGATVNDARERAERAAGMLRFEEDA
jgi:5-(carboxyamino)imidazole ribonucleotide synthase